MSAPSPGWSALAPSAAAPPASASSPEYPASAASTLQGVGDDLATWFERFVADLVASYGRLPISAVVIVLAALVGAVVVPWLVDAVHWVADRQPLSSHGATIGDQLRGWVPTTFRELLVRTVQLAVAILAALALVVVWGYGELVTDLRRSLATDLGDVIGLSLTLLLIALAFVGSDLLKRGIDRLGERADGVTEHQQEIALRVGQVTLFVALGAAILTLWSFDLTGLLVGAGFLGIVVGFAARETLGSLIAGFVLMLSRPFTVGDWVEIGEAEGVITDITMFNTRLQNVEAETLVLPNDVVASSTIVNRSRKGRLQIRREVGIDYASDPERAIDIATAAMEEVEDVIDSPDPQALPVRFDDSAIVLELRFWIDDPRPERKWAAIAGVLREVKAAFDAEGIDIPFPQRAISERKSAAEDERNEDGMEVDVSQGDESMDNGE